MTSSMPAAATTRSSAGRAVATTSTTAVSGVNTVEYSSATHSITVDLNEINRSGDPIIGGVLATAALSADTPVGYAQGQDIGVDVLINVQSATGGSGDDTIIGNSFNNILNGGIGADSLTGGAGNDTYVVDSIGDVVIGSRRPRRRHGDRVDALPAGGRTSKTSP